MKSALTILIFLVATTSFAQRPVLKFKDHKFKIVQFTDLHWSSEADKAARNDSTQTLMRNVIEIEHPDLVVLTGDIVVSRGAAKCWQNVIKPMVDAQVPFAVTFGNHDTETDLSKQAMLELLQNNKFNVTYNAEKNLSGVGNCSLPILSSDGKVMPWAIYLFDSHAYTNDSTLGHYDWIKIDQIQWYRRQSAEYKSKNGKTIPALAFFHIPLPEFEEVRKQKSTIGSIEESVASPRINSGLFASFVEMGDVMGTFVGHDHNNDYTGIWYNICLGFGRKTGYPAAYKEILPRGARIIELYENEKKFDTHIRTLSGTLLDYSFTRK